MKIGIMTFWESQSNYGQILQVFALQTFLEQNGHEAFVIRYKLVAPAARKKTVLERVRNFKLTRFVNNRRYKGKKTFEQVQKPRQFDMFKKEYLKFSAGEYQSVPQLVAAPPEADVYIAGSDQVWNNSFSVSCEAFLLGFGGNETKRLSYAASFGKKELDPVTTQLFERYIGKFNDISVREKSGLEICRKLGVAGTWVPDPTLLFNREEWLKLLKIPVQPATNNATKQVLLYTLGNSAIKDKRQYMQYARKVAGQNVVHVSANEDYAGAHYLTIQEWVAGIQKADFIITNSFHGVVFCIICNRNFVVLPNSGHAAGMNERIDSLLGRLDLTDHLMYEYNQERLDKLRTKNINWQPVNQTIRDWQEDALAFLQRNLN